MVYKSFAVPAAVLLSITGLSFTAFANDDDKARNEAKFKAMDADRDDRLTQNEVAGDPMLAEHFAALDRNTDGYLTKQEYAAHVKDSRNKQRRQY